MAAADGGCDPNAARMSAAGEASGGRRAVVPVIDVSPFFSDGASDEAKDAVSAAVARACEEVGFLAVTGHGLDLGIPRRCAEEARSFFARAEAEKAQVAANGRAYGFFPVSSEALGYDADAAKRPDLREAFSMGPQKPLPPAGSQGAPEPSFVVDFCYQETPWPQDGDLKEAMVEYYDAVGRLGDQLLCVIARALRVDEEFFLSKTDRHASSLRVVHYPKLKVEPTPGQLRCGAHSDIATLTLLWQDVHGGLQVLPAGCDEWAEVQWPEGALMVNLGDLFARWTNGRWLSTPHRVVPPALLDEEKNVSRISMPYFQMLNSDAEVRCIESCLREGEQPKYETTTQGEDLLVHFKRWGIDRGN